jgi:UMF1 family MFS transporter
MTSTREQRGWYMYDWANSAFYTTVITVLLGPYLTDIAKSAADSSGLVHPFGIPVDAKSLWGYLSSLSVGIQVLTLPVVGAIADYGRRKKEVLAATAYLGATSAALMFFVKGQDYLLGSALFMIANVAFGASVVIYNSFLPEIAAPDERDAVSSKGWGIGYIGGGVLLALNLVLLMKAESIGMSTGMAVRISLASSGVWWGVFTIPTLLALRNRGPARELPPGQSAVGTAVRQLKHTLMDVRRFPQTATFLLGYLLYNDAIQTVLTQVGVFGSEELKISPSELALIILVVQFVGFGGALGFNWLASKITAKAAVIVSLVIWTALLIYIYALLKTKAEFFVMVGIGGVIMGGSQALSRSLFAQLVPKGKEAEYFGIYEISDKGTSWLCPLLFGLAQQFTKSFRVAILSLIIFFVAGLLVLLKVDMERGQRDVSLQEG